MAASGVDATVVGDGAMIGGLVGLARGAAVFGAVAGGIEAGAGAESATAGGGVSTGRGVAVFVAGSVVDVARAVPIAVAVLAGSSACAIGGSSPRPETAKTVATTPIPPMAAPTASHHRHCITQAFIARRTSLSRSCVRSMRPAAIRIKHRCGCPPIHQSLVSHGLQGDKMGWKVRHARSQERVRPAMQFLPCWTLHSALGAHTILASGLPIVASSDEPSHDLAHARQETLAYRTPDRDTGARVACPRL